MYLYFDVAYQNLPDLIETVRPEESIIVRGSCLRSVEHRRSNSTLSASTPDKKQHLLKI